jgi:2-polyprenyl-3-methyl-5-hydroxy-6-metoxy-1,4-benzoquinol methylase
MTADREEPKNALINELETVDCALEHLHNPSLALEKIHHLLRDGGSLILSVPDISSFEMRLFRDKCHLLHIPQPSFFESLLAKNAFLFPGKEWFCR